MKIISEESLNGILLALHRHGLAPCMSLKTAKNADIFRV
jgi:hypothetical protein